MGDKQTERALASERRRHTEAAMALARRIRDDAADSLRALASGSIPTRHLVQDAVELDKRCTALATINDITGIYEAQLAELASPAG